MAVRRAGSRPRRHPRAAGTAAASLGCDATPGPAGADAAARRAQCGLQPRAGDPAGLPRGAAGARARPGPAPGWARGRARVARRRARSRSSAPHRRPAARVRGAPSTGRRRAGTGGRSVHGRRVAHVRRGRVAARPARRGAVGDAGRARSLVRCADVGSCTARHAAGRGTLGHGTLVGATDIGSAPVGTRLVGAGRALDTSPRVRPGPSYVPTLPHGSPHEPPPGRGRRPDSQRVADRDDSRRPPTCRCR